MLSISQGVLYYTKTAHLNFEWQSYSFVEKYMIGLIQGVCYSTTRLHFGWQSYSFVEKYMHGLGQDVFTLQ